MKNILFNVIILITLTHNAVARDHADCQLMVDTVQLPEVKVTDSLICTILDSALAMLKFDKIEGKEIPYRLHIYVKDDTTPSKIKELTILSTNSHVYRSSQKETEKHYINKAVLRYKGYNILVSIYELRNWWLKQFLAETPDKFGYPVYGFQTEGRKLLCLLPDFGIKQEILVFINPKKSKRKFDFMSICTQYSDSSWFDD